MAGKSSWRFFEHGLRFAKAMVNDSDSQFLANLNQELNDAGFGEFHLSSSAQNLSQTTDIPSQAITANHFLRMHLEGRLPDPDDWQHLQSLSAICSELMAVRASVRRFSDPERDRYIQQLQILDQIHESVITMDLAGFILSWNAGAERLFGYTAEEAIGQNVIFLYENEEDDPQSDYFLTHGGRTMEVRRKRKNGEVFWASLTLSILKNEAGQPVAMAGYLTDISDRKQYEEKLDYLSYFDALTSLPNRQLFLKLADQQLQTGARKQQRCAVLYVDLNRFKLINDTLGHQYGNSLLIEVGKRLKATLREEDIVAHLNGDEFAVMLTDIAEEYHASVVANKILEALFVPLQIGEFPLQVGASIGISIAPADGEHADVLLHRADIAMGKAKLNRQGASGAYAYYSQSLDAQVSNQLAMESALRRALQCNEFYLVFQPKYHAQTSQLAGSEALVRWRDPERGIQSPAAFIPAAEKSDLIQELDAWVLDKACQQAAQWSALGIHPTRIAVNLSAKSFTAQLPQHIAGLLQRYRIAPDWLELEITESTLMHSEEEVITIMKGLVALGLTLTLDDFGTGYSSLTYLKRFPIACIKIDQSFVRGIPADVSDCAIASAIISMAKRLQLNVVAEGVETEEQLAFLRDAECAEVQGYLLAKPMSVDEYLTILRRQAVSGA